MASTSKAFKKCVDPCPRYLTPDNTRSLRLFVWAKSTHAMSLRGQSACTVSCSLWESSVLICPSFRGKRGSRLLPAIRYPLLPRHGGDWNRGVRSWIWPMSWRRTAPFRVRRPKTRVSCWIVMMRSFWHQIQRLVLCWVMPRKSRRCWGWGSWDWTLSILLHCIWMSFWRLWIIKINLSGHKSPAQASLPSFINLDVEVEKEWKKLISRIHRFQHTSYADIEVSENGYEGDAPCARDDSQLISLWVRHPLSRLPPCHLSPWILLKWQGICSSRSDRRFVAHYGGASGVPDWSAERPG